MKKKNPFGELVLQAASMHRGMLKDDGRLNTAELARYYRRKEHPVPQETLWRNVNGKTKPSENTIEATSQVFGIPKELLRGEPVPTEITDLLGRYTMRTVLIAQKLERLPKDVFHNIIEQIERATDREEQLHKALRLSNNVESIDKHRR